MTPAQREKILERVRPIPRSFAITHPCAKTCSGYRQGVDDGSFEQSERDMVVIKELLDLCGRMDGVLEEIAKTKYGLDGNESKGFLTKYWANRAISYEASARKALADHEETLRRLGDG